MNNKRRTMNINSMKEIESLMYIPLTLALLEMRHLEQEDGELQNNNHQEEEVSK